MEAAGAVEGRRPAQLPVAILFGLIVGGIAALRLYHCLHDPANTGDLWRHLNYGMLVHKHDLGLAVVQYPLQDILPNANRVSWAHLPYNYPIITLLFFTSLTSEMTMTFMGAVMGAFMGPLTQTALLGLTAKLALTILEALNAIMLAAFTKDKWLGVLYWASPLSIWWVSREGQFEALPNFFSMLALVALRLHPALAFVALAAAIQVKVIPGALLFYLMWTIKDAPPKKVLLCLGAFAAGFIPSALAQLVYPHVQLVWLNSSPMLYNPYYWNIFEVPVYNMPPYYETPINQVAIKGYLLATLWCMWRARKQGRVIEYVPALLLLWFCSAHNNVVDWYILMLFPMYAIVSNPVERRWFIGMTFVFSIWGTVQLLIGPTAPI